MQFVQAAFDALSAREALSQLLPDYHGAKAIFQGHLAPADAPYPFVLVRFVAQNEGPTFEPGYKALIDIAVYDRVEQGDVRLAQITEQIIKAMRSGSLEADGYGRCLARFQGAIPAPYEHGVIGRIASFSLFGISET